MRASIGYETQGMGKPLSTVYLVSKTGNFIKIIENEDGFFVLRAKDAKLSIGRKSKIIIETKKIDPNLNWSDVSKLQYPLLMDVRYPLEIAIDKLKGKKLIQESILEQDRLQAEYFSV